MIYDSQSNTLGWNLTQNCRETITDETNTDELLKVGDHVEGLYKGKWHESNQWKMARITGIHVRNETVSLAWDDGETSESISLYNLRRPQPAAYS